MFLPIEHNGQIFNLAPQDSYYGAFRVVLERETFASDDAVEAGSPEEISEYLGTFSIDHHYGHISAWTRYGFATGRTFGSINEAVGFIVDTYRQCDHGDASGIGDNLWNCDICGVDFTLAD